MSGRVFGSVKEAIRAARSRAASSYATRYVFALGNGGFVVRSTEAAKEGVAILKVTCEGQVIDLELSARWGEQEQEA